MSPADPHQNLELLRAFGLGTIAGEAVETIARHLESCRDCRRVVADVPADRFLGRLQDIVASPGPLPQPRQAPVESAGAVGTSSSAVVPAAAPIPAEPIPAALAQSTEYDVLREINRGGMGIVYLVRNRRMDRLEGLKVVNAALLKRAGAQERFEREIRSAARLNHTNIVTAYSSPPLEGLLAFAMEYVDGVDLHQLVHSHGPLPVSNACYYIYQAAQGLEHAHERKMVHRDIKPNNLMLTRDGKKQIIKILDFGLAKATSENPIDAGLTGEGQMLGTPQYMAPEQISNASRADIRADLYSLGCTLYHLLTGAPPFKTKDGVYEILAAHHTEIAQPLNEVRQDIPAELAAIVAKMLAKNPEDRYQEPSEVAAELAPFFVQGVQSIPSGGAPSSTADDKADTRTSRAESTGISRPPPCVETPRVDGDAAGLAEQAITTRVAETGGIAPARRIDAKEKRSTPSQRVSLKTKLGFAVGALSLGLLGASVGIPGKLGFFEAGTAHTPPAVVSRAPSQPTSTARIPSAALLAFRRDRIPADALALAGDGDPLRAPASLVGVLGEATLLHTDLVRGVAFSPDGRWLASGSFDKTILLWDVASGRSRRAWRGHTGWITGVGFSGDSQTVVSASADGTLRFWPVEQETELRTLEPDVGAVWGMEVSRDGRFLVAGGTNGKIKIWKWGAWETPVELPAIVGEVFVHFNGNRNAALAFSADGGLLAVSGGGSILPQDSADKPPIPIMVFRTSDGGLVQTLPGHNQGMRSAQSLGFSHDGRFLASIVQDDQAKVWDLASGKLISGGFAKQQFGSVTFGPDDKTLLIGGSINGIHVYDVLSGTRERGVFAGHAHNWDVALSPNGQLVATGFYTGSVHFWKTDDWRELYLERGHRHQVRALALTSDGGALLSAGDDGTIRWWDFAQPEMNQIVHRFTADDMHPNGSPSGSVSIAVSPRDGRFAVVTRGADRTSCRLSVWDVTSMTELFHVLEMPDGIVFSPDGTALAGGCADGSVRLWDAERGNELHQFSRFGRSSALAFSPAGTLLAAASYENNRAAFWNVDSGSEIHAWHSASVFATAFYPDGKILATGHGDGAITLRDPATGQIIRVLHGHSARVRILKFTPDGRTLISSADDGTIRLWNPEDDRPREVIPLGPANAPLLFDLDSSGTYLAAAGAGPVIFLLRLPTAAEQAVVPDRSIDH